MNSIDRIKKTVNDNIIKAVNSVEKSCKVFFCESGNKNPDAIAYLYKAMYHMNLAQAAYYSHDSELESETSDELENIFSKFDLYATEFIDSYAEDHDFTYANNYFEQLQEAYQKYQNIKF